MLPSSSAGGYTLIELMFVAGLIAVVSVIAIPQVLVSLDRSRGLIAARYLGARVALARMQAVKQGASVALRFETRAGEIAFSVYQDGNRNGVRNAEIARQIDRLIDAPMHLTDHFPGVSIALAPGMPVADPVQIGNSDLLSFSPMGTATSGTIYILGRDGTQWAVRVLGATGRTRVLRYVVRTGEWMNAS